MQAKKVQPKQHPSQIAKARLNRADCCKNMGGIISVKCTRSESNDVSFVALKKAFATDWNVSPETLSPERLEKGDRDAHVHSPLSSGSIEPSYASHDGDLYCVFEGLGVLPGHIHRPYPAIVKANYILF
jgi:hypothetical protein